MPADIQVIVNPTAGSPRSRRQSSRLARELRASHGTSLSWTETPGHATDLARTALAQNASQIVVIGGDGTLNEVVNGFFGDDGRACTEAVLIPMGGGTGGDFRRTLEEMTTPRLHPVPMDVIRVTYTTEDGATATRYALNIVSAGLGGVVVRDVKRVLRVVPRGPLAYFAAILQSLWRYDHDDVQVLADGRDLGVRQIRNIAVANGRYFGGGLKIAPYANIDDGALDLVLLDNVPFPHLLRDVRAIYAGNHSDLSYLHHVRARSVTLRPCSSRPVFLDIDGEGLGRLPATLEVIPAALQIALPRAALSRNM